MSVYQLFYFDAKDIYFLRLLLYYVGIPEKKISTYQKDFRHTKKKDVNILPKKDVNILSKNII